MDIYNNKTMVYDANQDKDIEILAPTFKAACDYEEFLAQKPEDSELIKYRRNHNIVLDFHNKQEYDQKLSDENVIGLLENGMMTGRFSVNPLLIGLTVDLAHAFEHVKDKLDRPDMTRAMFEQILARNEIHNFANAGSHNNLKAQLAKGKHTTRELNAMKSILHNLANALDVAESRIQFKDGKAVILGKTGELYYQGDDWYLSVKANGLRHGTTISNKLPFMTYVQPFLKGSLQGIFKLNRLPSPAEAALIRELASIKKAGKKTPKLVPHAEMAPTLH